MNPKFDTQIPRLRQYKTKLPEEEENTTLFRVVILYSDIPCCAKSDMIANGNRDIKTYGFSDILFAYKARKANNTRRQPNITAKQYHSTQGE